MTEPGGVDRASAQPGILLLFCVLRFVFRSPIAPVINLVVDTIRHELSPSVVAISLLKGAGFAAICELAGFPSGRLADRANRRDLIAAGVARWSAADVLCVPIRTQ